MVLNAIRGYLCAVTPTSSCAGEKRRVPWALLLPLNEARRGGWGRAATGTGGTKRAGVPRRVQQPDEGGVGGTAGGCVQRPRACLDVVAGGCLGTPLGGGAGSASDAVLNAER
jgi:hypothetical protein